MRFTTTTLNAKPIYEKMSLKPKDRVIFLNAPKEVAEKIQFPGLTVATTLTQTFDHILLFVTTQDEMNTQFPTLKPHLNPNDKLWVAWPKAKQLNSNLSVKTVIKIGYNHGLVESTNLSIDSVWTALKFTWPIPGKEYQNSYGVLPTR